MLSESDKEFISNNPDLTVEELAEKTKRPIKEIENFKVKHKDSRNQKKLVQKTNSGIAIMQPGVSQSADEMSTSVDPYDKPYIQKVKK